jgi:C-terminal processing protease CtpA/Prc
VIGVPEYEGKPAVPDVKAGDVLIKIDKVPAKGSTMGQIWSLLGGSPGDTRVLTLEREGKQFTANATVIRFLPASK